MIYAIFSDYLTFLQLVMIVKLWLVLTWMFFQAVTCKLCVINCTQLFIRFLKLA